MCICVHLSEYVCTVCVHSVLRGEKKALDALELELEMVVSCFVGVGKQTEIL